MKKMKRLAAMLCCLVLILQFGNAFAATDGFNTSYTYIYDYWEDPQQSPDVYRVLTDIDSLSLGLENLNGIRMNNPDSLFVQGEMLYICDTMNNRIIEVKREGDNFIFSRIIDHFIVSADQSSETQEIKAEESVPETTENLPAEQAIDNAIISVTSDVVTKVAVISDNSSGGYEYFIKTLEENNYEVSEISIEKDGIEENIDMVIVYEPEKDFTDQALIKLEDFMKNGDSYGKTLLYVPDIEGNEHTKLDSFINMFGISLAGGIAFEDDANSRYYENNYYEYLICDFASDLYRENFSEGRYTPVMTGLARPINIRSDDVEPLLVLSEKSGTVPYDADSEWSMEDSITGNVCLMAQVSVGSKEKSSTLVTMGSGTMVSETYFVNTLGNRNYIMTMLAALNGRTSEIISVSDKVITNFDIEADAHTRFWIGFVVYALIPLLILGCGLTVYLVRRGK